MWLIPYVSRRQNPVVSVNDPVLSFLRTWMGEDMHGSSESRAQLTNEIDKTSYTFTVPVPGAESKDVEVEVDADMLSVTAKVKLDDGERNYRNQFWLPEDADQNEIQASVKNGLAKIVVARRLPYLTGTIPRSLKGDISGLIHRTGCLLEM